VRTALRDAALELVGDVSFNDLRVDDVARRAGVSRSAFYLYYRDKHDLLMTAAGEVAETLYEQADRWWHGEGDGRMLIRQALAGVVHAYVEHKAIMRVAAEVSTYDEEVGEWWRRLIGRFVDATAEQLRKEAEAGLTRELDPEWTAEALCWMSERCCYVHLAVGHRDPEEVVDALWAVWIRAIYP
jgi:TetR/AcrR family transcriptional regulator, ethionamide resistance regulator